MSTPAQIPKTLEEVYAELEKSHGLFLSKHGVVLPNRTTQQAISLAYLYLNLGELVSLESLRSFVREKLPEGSKDIQPRHLKYDGWYLLLSGKADDRLPKDCVYLDKKGEALVKKTGEKVPNGHIMLVSVTSPSPDFELKKRRGALDRSSWESIKAAYDNRCGVCGREKKVEQGHMDPTKPLSLENTIPMCSDCNNWASSDVILDANGRVTAVASPRFVKTASLEARIKIFAALAEDKEVNPKRRQKP